jgi:recombination protein RecA
LNVLTVKPMLSSAHELRRDIVQPSPWNLAAIAGRFIEISASASPASLTLAFGLVREAQNQREPVGWVTSMESFFYPPDAAHGGVDLAALVIIRVLHAVTIPTAGEKLLRSGGFGLVVLDLGTADIPMPLQSRLTGLAQRHHAALVCLTEKESKTFSLGSLVSLRAHAERQRSSDHRFACRLRVLKDKRHGPTWSHEELCHGPAGLC